MEKIKKEKIQSYEIFKFININKKKINSQKIDNNTNLTLNQRKILEYTNHSKKSKTK